MKKKWIALLALIAVLLTAIPSVGATDYVDFGAPIVVPETPPVVWEDPIVVPQEPIPGAPETQPTAPAEPGIPNITKHPTGETVEEGQFAEFVARADYCSSIVWHFISPSGSDVLVSDGPVQFPGLYVSGLGTERLLLDKIPKSLTGWRVRAEFVGREGSNWSDSALITVKEPELIPPTIYEQPKSVQLQASEATRLQVGANTTEAGAVLSYQWYLNTTNSNLGGQAIMNATESTFVPDYAVGTYYYYCVVRSSSGLEARSECAAVTYPQEAPVATAPTQAVTATEPTPATTAPTEPTISFQATTSTEAPVKVMAPQKSNSLLMVFVVAILVIAALGILAAVLIMRFFRAREEEEEYEEEEVEYISPKRKPQPRPQQKVQPKPQPRPQRRPAPQDDDIDLDEIKALLNNRRK